MLLLLVVVAEAFRYDERLCGVWGVHTGTDELGSQATDTHKWELGEESEIKKRPLELEDIDLLASAKISQEQR